MRARSLVSALCAALICSVCASLPALAKPDPRPDVPLGQTLPIPPKALRIVVAGAGGPMANPARTAQSIAVLADQNMLLFDCGPATSRNIDIQRLPTGRLTQVFFTHYHSDHITDFGEVRLASWIAGRAVPLAAHGPTGLADVMDGFEKVYAKDIAYRAAHHGPAVLAPEGAALDVREFAPPAGEDLLKVYENGELRVFAFSVDHRPADPAVGYRVEYGERSVVISGDSAVTPSLLRASRGADILFADGLAKMMIAHMANMAEAAGNTRMGKLLADIPSYHMSPLEAAALARDAGVKELVFVHVTPPLTSPPMEDIYLTGVAGIFKGETAIAADGMVFTLPR